METNRLLSKQSVLVLHDASYVTSNDDHIANDKAGFDSELSTFFQEKIYNLQVCGSQRCSRSSKAPETLPMNALTLLNNVKQCLNFNQYQRDCKLVARSALHCSLYCWQ